MSGAFMSLLIVQTVLTAAAIGMFLYRSMLDLKEGNQLILDDAEAHLARDQETIRHKVTTVSRYIRMVGIAWSVLAVVILSLWIAAGLDLV